MIAPWARRAALFVAVVSVVVGFARSARAESTLVVIERSPTETGNSAEVINRVRGELLADGFRVEWVGPTSEDDRVLRLTREGRTAAVAVAAGLWLGDEAKTVELALVDELTGRTLVRRLEIEQAQAPEVIARRSVEFLRAGLLDFLVDSLRSAIFQAGKPAPLIPRIEPGDAAARSRWAIEVGVGVLGSFEGVAPATMPLARVRFAANPALQLRLTTGWFGTQPLVQAPAGEASVAQGLALMEMTAHFWRRSLFRPFVSLGAGTYYVEVAGTAVAPDRSRRSSAVAFAVDAGLGVASPIGSHFEVLLEAQAVIADPGLAVRFLGVEAARIGRPSALGTLTIAGWI